jgi:protein gp37
MTKIEWCDETINPQGWGCYGPDGTPENPKPCSYCYARRFAARNTRGCDLCHQFIPHWHIEAMDKPTKWRKPRKIFWQSMGDLFHPCSPENQIRAVLSDVRDTPRHTHIFLTKNPKRLKDFNPWPSNCWVGTTVTNQADADERLPWLLQVEAPVRFVSHEPLLDATRMRLTPGRRIVVCPSCHSDRWQGIGSCGKCGGAAPKGISWAIIGGMTGPGAVEAKCEWIQGLIDQYRAAGVPIFLKSNLKWPEKIQEWPNQEKP